MSPLISILTATYNRSTLLSRAWKSIEKQTFQNWEWIVIDDGSDDNTFDTLKPALKTKKVRYFWHHNQKQPLSLNVGLKLALGKYVSILDSDDEYLPQHLQKRLEIIENQPYIDILEGGMEIIGNPFVPDKNNIDTQIHLDECVAGGTFFGKTEVFKALNGFQNLAYASDADFLERASHQQYQIFKVKEKTYRYYRDTPDSICNNL
ncbi:MAG: glycosyltransferase [Bacteroidetes bacterium]|nr:MAG: glycosyltransferase [Bacteroidota bacterium]TAG85359.1 MAG: glycosyltransferase [Bacteroidota bacterium]